MFAIRLIYLSILLFSFASKAAGPFCPSAPANCSFSNVQKGLKELKEDRFFGLLKSPDSSCKAALMEGVKPENVLPELMADPRFVSYVTPQIMQCWKEGGASNAKLETLARYAYIQRRLDENADNLLDYQVFADSVLGNEPLSNISDCKKVAPELAGLVTKCENLKANCKKSDGAKTLAQNFMDDYKSQDIKAIDAKLKEAKKIWDNCSPRQRPGLICKNAKEEAGRLAFRLQVFYANYPWAQEDKFMDIIGKRGVDDINLVTKALTAQVSENSKNVAAQLKDLTTASQCLLRNNCDTDKVNDVIERTKPLADQYSFKKGEAREKFRNRAAVSQFVWYNNCLDDLGESQRKTSTVMWTSGIGAVGAIVTMGGSLALTGLTAGGRAVVGAAAIGSRAASAGKYALMLGQAVDGSVAAHSVHEASGHCGSKSTAYLKKTEQLAGPQMCGIPSTPQMEFKKEYDGCVVDMVLGAAGGAGLLMGLKNARKANQMAAEAQQTKAVANAEKPAVQAAAAGATAEKAAAATANSAEKAATKAATTEQATTESVNAATKTSSPIDSVSSSASKDQTPTKLVSEGDYISLQSEGKRYPAVVLQTQERSGMKMYQVASQTADGKVTKKWISQQNMEAMKPRISETSKSHFSSKNLNKEFAQSAIQNISRGSPPETVRAVVGKLNDAVDGGAARLEIASRVVGRELSDAEKKWVLAAHNTHSDTTYGKIGSQKVRDKIKAGEGRPTSLNAAQTRQLMEYGITGTETSANVARRADIPGSTLNGRSNITLEAQGKQMEIRIVDSTVANGEIWHKVEYAGPNGTLTRSLKEADFAHMVKPQVETAAAKAVDAVPSPQPIPKPVAESVSTTPAPPTRTLSQMQQDARPLNASAANDIEALNQSQMKTLVNRNRPENLNGNSITKPERMRDRYGDNLGITDRNRRAAIDYAPVADNKTMTSAMQKALGSDSKVDVKQLRQMMSFNPGRGYVTQNEFANAARFVTEINAKGGAKALDKLPLTASEREALNALMERAPAYASYVDPKVRPLGQIKIRKSPVEATNPDRDVVFTNAQGQTIQGKETIRQVGSDGENLSTIRVTNADGSVSTTTIRTSQTMDVAEAQRLQNFDRGLTERANANHAAHVAKTEQPNYVNPHGVAKTDLQNAREVKVKVQTMDGVKDVDAVVTGAPFKGVRGTQEIQVRYQAGVENGKPVYKFTSVNIDEIENIKPLVTVVPAKVEVVPFKPIVENIRRPNPAATDPDTYDGKIFRKSVDKEAADIILDRRIGSHVHIRTLQKEIDNDYLLIREANVRDRNVMYVSQQGMTSDKRFNPRIFYAHQSNEFHAATTAPKGSPGASVRGQAEEAFKGTIRYKDDGTTYRANSARDVALRAAREQNMAAEEIAKLEKWMNDFDEAAPRIRSVERAEVAQKEFEAMQSTLQKALQNDSSTAPLTQSTFEKLAKNLNDLMLPPAEKQAAEVALKKLRCSRPEWTVRDGQFSNFNLKCD